MRIAVIISSLLGLPVLEYLAGQGVVAGIATPVTGSEEAERLALALTQSGATPLRLTRAGLPAALAEWIADLAPTAVLVLTFPWRIPAAVLGLPPEGFINFHFAALPGYRGPEPTFWQIRNGEAAGAVTAHRMDADFDTGPVLVAEAVPIGPHDTFGLHRAQLAQFAVAVGQHLLAGLRGETLLRPQPQNPAAARYWPRPVLADVCVNWQEPAEAIHRLVRAANPWNRGALATSRGQPLRLLGVTPRPETVTAPPGTIVLATPGQGLLVACGAGQVLQIDMVALEEGYFTGAQLAGMGLQVGEVLGTLAVPALEPETAAVPMMPGR